MYKLGQRTRIHERIPAYIRTVRGGSMN